ncbi:MAG: TIGR04149 family rSAM-modified RiPP [Lentimicrobiaceae bacterium]|nr:TIGR04149 family rSAM-modified RiPP [Lentimicrobiaceae bacterium]
MSKIKLTNLSHLKTLNEELSHLKGGDDPTDGPLCWGCKCICQCVNNKDADTIGNNNKNSSRNDGGSSWLIDTLIPFAAV